MQYDKQQCYWRRCCNQTVRSMRFTHITSGMWSKHAQTQLPVFSCRTIASLIIALKGDDVILQI